MQLSFLDSILDIIFYFSLYLFFVERGCSVLTWHCCVFAVRTILLLLFSLIPLIIRLEDDGWFYEGVVVKQVGHGSCLVQDEDGELETFESSELLPRMPLIDASRGAEVCLHVRFHCSFSSSFRSSASTLAICAVTRLLYCSHCPVVTAP